MAEALLTRWLRLRSEVTKQKRRLKNAKEDLWRAKAALVAFEAECKAHGIALVTVAPRGEGAIHGPAADSHS